MDDVDLAGVRLFFDGAPDVAQMLPKSVRWIVYSLFQVICKRKAASAMSGVESAFFASSRLFTAPFLSAA